MNEITAFHLTIEVLTVNGQTYEDTKKGNLCICLEGE